MFGQLTHLSLKLRANISISDLLIISGDTIQQLCIDRLNSLITFTFDLVLIIKKDTNDKIILDSSLKAPFTNRQRSKIIVRDNYTLNHMKT
jgi:hypothetical protein